MSTGVPTKADTSKVAEPRQGLITACFAITIAVVVLLTYSNSFDSPFVFDDISSISANPTIRHLWPLQSVLGSGQNTTVGRPLLNLSLAFNYALSGEVVTSYHAVNLAIHLWAAVVLFGLIRRTLTLPMINEKVRRRSTVIAAISSLIWAIHPIQTESVTYVIQRAESLVGLFYLLTLYCSLRAATSVNSLAWSFAASVACMCGAASKEVIVSAPLAVMAFDRVFLCDMPADKFNMRRVLYVMLFLSWVPLIGLVIFSGGRESTVGFGHGISSWDYAMTQFVAIVRYLGQCFRSDPQVVDYGTGVVRDVRQIIPCAMIVLMLFVGSLILLRRKHWLGFLGFTFFAVLSPSSSFIPIVTQTVAIHRMYLPLAAIVVPCVLACWLVPIRLRSTTGTPVPSALSVGLPMLVSTMVVIFLSYMTLIRNSDYRDPRQLWEKNVAAWPDSLRPYAYRAALFMEDGNAASAADWYDRAIAADLRTAQENTRTTATDSQLAVVYYGRSVAMARLGRSAEASADLDQALKLHPESHHNRGLMLESIGRDEDAIHSLTSAINADGENAELWFDRGRVKTRLQRFDDAISDLNSAVQLDSSNADFVHLRGTCFVQLGRNQEALSDLMKAIHLRPGFVQATYDRALVYAAIKQFDQAIADFSTVIKMSSNYPEALLNRAKCFYYIGRLPQASEDYQHYLSIGGQSDNEFADRLINTQTRK